MVPTLFNSNANYSPSISCSNSILLLVLIFTISILLSMDFISWPELVIPSWHLASVPNIIMTVHSYQDSHFQMYSLGSCIVAYLVIRKYLSIEFSPLITLGIPAFKAIAEFIIYLYFSIYLLGLFVVLSCCYLLILNDCRQHPLLTLIPVEVTASLVFAFDSLCIPGFVCLNFLFLEDGLDTHLLGFSFLLSNFYFVLQYLRRCCCFYPLVIAR